MKRRSFIKGLIGGLIAAPVSAAVVKDSKAKIIPVDVHTDKVYPEIATQAEVLYSKTTPCVDKFYGFDMVGNPEWIRFNDPTKAWAHNSAKKWIKGVDKL